MAHDLSLPIGLHRPPFVLPLKKPLTISKTVWCRWFTNILTRRSGCVTCVVYVSSKQKATGGNGESRHYKRGNLFLRSARKS